MLGLSIGGSHVTPDSDPGSILTSKNNYFYNQVSPKTVRQITMFNF